MIQQSISVGAREKRESHGLGVAEGSGKHKVLGEMAGDAAGRPQTAQAGASDERRMARSLLVCQLKKKINFITNLLALIVVRV